MEFDSVMRYPLNNGSKNTQSIKKNNLNQTNINLSRSPITSSSGDENGVSTDEDIIKLSRDLTNTFGSLLGDSDQPPPFSDVIFRVKDRRFFASKIMLVSRSEYFKAMFMCSMKESTIKEITLEGVEPDVFFVVLRYICVGILDLDFDIRIIGSIYQYCDLLGLNRGKELALGIMTRSAISFMEKPDLDNALMLWDSANRNLIAVEAIHPTLRAFIIQYASLILYSELFVTLSEKTVCDMLRNDGLRMEELDILECVVEWCRANSTCGYIAPAPKSGGSKRNSASYPSDRKRNEDGESTASCSSSRCSSRRGSVVEKETGDLNRSGDSDTDESYDEDDDEESDYDDEFTDDDDKEDSANDDLIYYGQDDSAEEWDETIDRNLLNKLLPLIRWENMNIGEAFERLDNLKIITEKDITNLLRGIIRANRGDSFQFLGFQYKRPRNMRKRTYPLEFLLGISQPFDSKVSNEIIPLNSFGGGGDEFGQASHQFLYRVKKDIKLPANLERFTFKDREFFVQLKEREKGQLAVYLAFGSKLFKPLAMSVSASIIGFRFQESIEFSYKKLFEEGFDSAWGWPRFISLDALQKDKFTHYGDSFCILLEMTSQWG